MLSNSLHSNIVAADSESSADGFLPHPDISLLMMGNSSMLGYLEHHSDLQDVFVIVPDAMISTGMSSLWIFSLAAGYSRKCISRP